MLILNFMFGVLSVPIKILTKPLGGRFNFTIFFINLFQRYHPQEYYERNRDLKQVLDQIKGGFFSPEEPGMFTDIYNSVMYNDR